MFLLFQLNNSKLIFFEYHKSNKVLHANEELDLNVHYILYIPNLPTFLISVI